jgi:plasmid stabilization system protein ParE
VKLRIPGRARARIREQDAWWREHRSDASELFKQELATAFARILRAPKVRKQYGQIEGEPVWRILMPKTEQHVYYTVDDAADEVVIETVWSARRGRGPRL